jgi:hypothetical protein
MTSIIYKAIHVRQVILLVEYGRRCGTRGRAIGGSSSRLRTA